MSENNDNRRLEQRMSHLERKMELVQQKEHASDKRMFWIVGSIVIIMIVCVVFGFYGINFDNVPRV